MFKFIHAADIHLDSPLRGLERYEGAPVDAIRNATRRALDELVQLAIQQKVDFVVIAGDLYDGDWRDYSTGLVFIKQCARLREAGIPIYLIAGNHDAANKMTKTLSLPSNVTLLSSSAPETVLLDELGVAIHGQSFATAAVLDDLSAEYPSARSGMFNLGILHTSAAGHAAHEPYAPCTLDGLRLKGYDYWALGHIHQREVLSDEPYIAFSGNIQGRHIREAGAKGCLLVTVSDDHAVETEFCPLDVLRWEECIVDLSEANHYDDALECVSTSLRNLHLAAEGRMLAVRVVAAGPTDLHGDLLANRHRWIQEVRSQAIDIGGEEIWIEKVKLETQLPSHQTELDMSPDSPIGQLQSLVQELKDQATDLAELGIDFNDLIKRLPAELKDSTNFDDSEWLQTALDEAEQRLLRTLREKGPA